MERINYKLYLHITETNGTRLNGNEMSLSEMERNDPSPAEMDGSAWTDFRLPCSPARLLARFRTAVPCVVKELFWFVLFLCISPKHEFIIKLFKTIVKKNFKKLFV